MIPERTTDEPIFFRAKKIPKVVYVTVWIIERLISVRPRYPLGFYTNRYVAILKVQFCSRVFIPGEHDIGYWKADIYMHTYGGYVISTRVWEKSIKIENKSSVENI